MPLARGILAGAVLGQTLTIEKRPHPYGEKGVRLSLDEVAKRIKDGFQHPAVVTWASECVQRAAKEEGKRADTDHDRASILLRAVQRKLWLPDPVGTEWMAAAHLMACDKSTPEKLCIIPKDCDDRIVIWGAACMSVGIHFMVVGHSYNDQQAIEHVLGVVRLGRKPDDKWLYGDPSTDDWPLGKCLPPKRERLISLPDMKVRCDETACLWQKDPKQWDPDKSGFVTSGTFVGVSGLPIERPDFMWLPTEDEESIFLSGLLGDSGGSPWAAGLDAAKDCDVDSQAGGRACTQAVASAAAAAFCGAAGGVAAGICASAAGQIAGPLYDMAAGVWNSLFGGDSLEEQNAKKKAANAYYFSQQQQAFEMEKVLYARADEVDRALVALDDSLRPRASGPYRTTTRLNVLDARTLLMQLGLKTYADGTCSSVQATRDGAVAARDACLGVPPLKKWWYQGESLTTVMNRGKAWLVQLEWTKKKAAALIVGDAAAGRAIEQTREGSTSTTGTTSSKKTSYFWPIAGTLGLGSLVWWATRPLGK